MCVEILPAHATSDPPDRSGAQRRAPHPRRHNDEVPAAAAGPDHLGAPHRLPRTFAAHGAAADIDQTSRRFHGSSLCKLTCGFVRHHARASPRSAAAPVAAVANGGDRDRAAGGAPQLACCRDAAPVVKMLPRETSGDARQQPF